MDGRCVAVEARVVENAVSTSSMGQFFVWKFFDCHFIAIKYSLISQ